MAFYGRLPDVWCGKYIGLVVLLRHARETGKEVVLMGQFVLDVLAGVLAGIIVAVITRKFSGR